jgi:hypothetical protein
MIQNSAANTESNQLMRSTVFLVLLFALLVPETAAHAQQTSPVAAPNSQASQTKSAAPLESSTSSAEIQVWVNTNSGVYHCPGTHWYGATKSGTYMKQSEAQQKGYRPAYHRACK